MKYIMQNDEVTNERYVEITMYVYFHKGLLVRTQDAPTMDHMVDVYPMHASGLRKLCADEDSFFVNGSLFDGRVLKICTRLYGFKKGESK